MTPDGCLAWHLLLLGTPFFTWLCVSWPCMWMKELIPVFCDSSQRSSRTWLWQCRRKTHCRQSCMCVTLPSSSFLRTVPNCPGCSLAGPGSRPAAALWIEVIEGGISVSPGRRVSDPSACKSQLGWNMPSCIPSDLYNTMVTWCC